MYRDSPALFTAICISLLTYVSARAMTSGLAPDVPDDAATVHNYDEERAPILSASTSSTIKETTENLLRTDDRLKSMAATDNQSLPYKKRKGTDIEFESTKKTKLSKSIENLDEDTILLMIVGAYKHDLESKDLESFLLEKWDNDGNKLEDILERPSFATLYEILKYPMPRVWDSYGKKVGQDSYDMLLKGMTRRYGEDELVAILMKRTKDGVPVKSLATKLVNLQFKKWKHGGKSLRDVYLLLQLDQQNDVNLLRDPALRMWFSYATWLREDPFAWFMAETRTRMDDAKIAKLLDIAGRGGGDNKDLIEELRFYLFTEWKLSGKKSSDAEGTSYGKYLESVRYYDDDFLMELIGKTGTLKSKTLHDQKASYPAATPSVREKAYM